MSEFTERSANIHDVYDITQSLSDISRQELSSHPHSTSWDVMKAVMPMLKAGPAIAWCEDGKPLMIFGHTVHPLAAPDRITWFMATQRYFELGPRGVRFGRGLLKRLQRDWPRTRFWTYSGSKHPAMHRWFKLLGYAGMVDKTKQYTSFVIQPPPIAAKQDSPKRA